MTDKLLSTHAPRQLAPHDIDVFLIQYHTKPSERIVGALVRFHWRKVIDHCFMKRCEFLEAVRDFSYIHVVLLSDDGIFSTAINYQEQLTDANHRTRLLAERIQLTNHEANRQLVENNDFVDHLRAAYAAVPQPAPRAPFGPGDDPF